MIALLLLASLMLDPPQYVEVLEHNTVICHEVRWESQQWTWRVDVQLRQWIAWDFDCDGTYHVVWWSLDKGERPIYYDNLWRVRIDGRDVVARRLEITVTDYDPEVADRAAYPQSARRGLHDFDRIKTLETSQQYEYRSAN